MSHYRLIASTSQSFLGKTKTVRWWLCRIGVKLRLDMSCGSRPRPTLPHTAVLDGGVGTFLIENGHPEIAADPLWGSGLLYRDIDSIKHVHMSFLGAGADVIETVTYQASVGGFTNHLNISEDEALNLIKRGVEAAIQTRDTFWETNQHLHEERLYPLVAGSVGPYGACQNDGSEYTGAYISKITIEELMAWHRPRIRMLLEGGVDLLAIDTIPAQKEALAVVQLLAEFPDARGWLSFSCKDGKHTCYGEEIGEVIKSVSGCKQLMGIGFNCTAPEHIADLLRAAQPHVHNKKLIVYPNSGEEWTAEKSWYGRENRRALHHYAAEWYSLGAHWIGGCCRILPKDITELRQVMCKLKDEHAKQCKAKPSP